MINGNRGNRGIGIKAIHWNKGSSYLTNMMDEIEAVVADHSPHVLGLFEANFLKNHNLRDIQIENSEVHLPPPTFENPELNAARIVVYTQKSLVVKSRGMNWKMIVFQPFGSKSKCLTKARS